MTQQAQPQWPRLGGCPWLNLAPLCCTLTQFPAHSLAFPQAPTEPRPAAWVNAARSKTLSVGQTCPAGRRWRQRCPRGTPGQRRLSCSGARRDGVATCGASLSANPEPAMRECVTVTRPGRVRFQQIRLTSPTPLAANLPASPHPSAADSR